MSLPAPHRVHRAALARRLGATCLVLGIGAALVSTPARAELRSSLEAGTRGESPERNARFGPFLLAPTFRIDQPRWRVVADGLAIGGYGGFRLEGARATAGLLVASQGPLTAEAELDAFTRYEAGETPRDVARGTLRLHLARPSAGLWLGGSAAAASHSVEQRSVLSFLDLGAWARRRRFTFTTSVEEGFALVSKTPRLSSAGPDSAGPIVEVGRNQLSRSPYSQHVSVTTAQVGVQWSGPRVDLATRAGIAVSEATRPQRWLRVESALWMNRGVALAATAGTRPPDAFRVDSPGKLYLSAAVRVSTARAPDADLPLVAGAQAVAWSIRPLGEGRHLLAVRVPGARLVEVMGDMTAWSPLPLDPKDSELWEIVLPMGPGVHQINLRIDGGPWAPPPGAPSMSDGYSGTVGVLVIEE